MKPVFFNSGWTNNTLKTLRGIKPELLHPDATDQTIYDMYLMNRFFTRYSVYDRSEKMTTLFNLKNVSPIPPMTTEVISFADASKERAEYLIARGLRIYVYWSGGIDSTAALVALLVAGATDQLMVICNQASIFEYPWFFETFIKDKIPYQLVDNNVRSAFPMDGTAVCVTGELGDQIMGSVAIMDHPTHELFESYRLSIPEHIQEIMFPFINAAPMQIETLFDYIWWMSFVTKWQGVKTRFLYTMPRISKEFSDPYQYVEHFYDSILFQQWSMSRYEDRIRRYHHTYKWVAKDYIFQFTGDKEYRDHKKKVASLRGIAAPEWDNWRFIMEDGQVLYEKDIMK